MSDIGEYLRSLRVENRLSMAEVKKLTSITDSRLSRIENGENNEPSPTMLRELARLYKVNIIDLYKIAGYITDMDTESFSAIFTGVENLDAFEIKHIQDQIDFLSKRKLERQEVWACQQN